MPSASPLRPAEVTVTFADGLTADQAGRQLAAGEHCYRRSRRRTLTVIPFVWRSACNV